MRITELRTYLFNIIDTLTLDKKYQINADFLGDIGDFSLDKIPTETIIQSFINGKKRYKDVYNFRSRKAYSSDIINNLANIGFFEDFEAIIENNNRKGILPNINGIESIECLNCGSLNSVAGDEAIFDIQIQVSYIANKESEEISL